MNVKRIKEFKDTIIFVLNLILLLLFILFMKLLYANWDWNAIKIDSFIMVAGLSLYAKLIGTQYAIRRALQEEDILSRERQLTDLYLEVLNSGKTIIFDKMLYFFGEKEKIEKIFKKISQKLTKANHNRTKKPNPKNELKYDTVLKQYNALLDLQNALNDKKYYEYEKLANSQEIASIIDVKKVKHKCVTSKMLFNQTDKKDGDTDHDRIKFSLAKEKMSYNLPFFFMTLAFSYFYSCITVAASGELSQAIIDICTMTMSVVNGVFSGFMSGGNIVRNDYKCNLNERIKLCVKTTNEMQYLK